MLNIHIYLYGIITQILCNRIVCVISQMANPYPDAAKWTIRNDDFVYNGELVNI